MGGRGLYIGWCRIGIGIGCPGRNFKFGGRMGGPKKPEITPDANTASGIQSPPS